MVRERRDPEQRPSPEALLEAARRAESASGKLKIFVGAAPGVGKTYEMLQSAHAKRKAGIDVVVGFVETHGRAETEALVRGLEMIPRKKLDYRGQIVEEMDLDAVIARRPAIALVDELASTLREGMLNLADRGFFSMDRLRHEAQCCIARAAGRNERRNSWV